MKSIKERSANISTRISRSFALDPVTVATIVYYAVRIAILCWKEHEAKTSPTPHDLFLEMAKSKPRATLTRTVSAVRQSNNLLNRRQAVVIAEQIIEDAKESSNDEFEKAYQEAQNDKPHSADLGSYFAGQFRDEQSRRQGAGESTYN